MRRIAPILFLAAGLCAAALPAATTQMPLDEVRPGMRGVGLTVFDGTRREEFGVEVSDDIEIRVWDSSAELRYLVLPQRPAGTEGLSEDELAALVTRDSMIGTALVEAPAG